MRDELLKLYENIEKLEKKLKIAKEALERIPALTHSWIIAEQTMYCKHTYGEIRAEAKEALKQIENIDV